MIVIAGPNGSGQDIRHSKVPASRMGGQGTLYINPDEVAKDKYGDWNSPEAILKAANYCAELRETCLSERKSFVFETVMSAEDKVAFIIKAKRQGFFIRLFFISTSHPSINAARIANRVMKGGHDVPITKIISRYFKSIENCKTVAPIVDRLYVYDNSIDGEDAKLQFRLVNGELKKMYVTEVSEWAKILLPDAR